MTHVYAITGMTCNNCIATVKKAIESVPGVTGVRIQLESPQASIDMSQHVPLETFRKVLSSHPKYQISEATPQQLIQHFSEPEEERKSFWASYKPILLVFAFILGVTLLNEYSSGAFVLMRWMQYFMAGFFLVFSFFKLLDVPAFAASYSSYDVVAKSWVGWGYIYPFVELTLGILFLLNIYPLATNIMTFVVMGISSIGVFQSILAKRKIKCACLGAVFNLPMSTITLIEDMLMVVMSAYMISQHI
ncbi:MAG: cation transporter [Bacteroidota bacterium]|nr:cation transporter [Bacteroidota bacterium]